MLFKTKALNQIVLLTLDLRIVSRVSQSIMKTKADAKVFEASPMPGQSYATEDLEADDWRSV